MYWGEGKKEKIGERRCISSLQEQVGKAALIEHWHSHNKLKSSALPLELQVVFYTLSWAKQELAKQLG